MRHSLLLWLLLLAVPAAVAAAPKEAKNTRSVSSQEWEKFASDKKQLIDQASRLNAKRQDCARRAHEKKKKVIQAQEKVKKCLPLLLRIGRTNPLRFLVDLKATKASVRGVILLRAVAASLTRHMKKAQADLHELIALATDLDSQGRQLDSNFQNLHTHQDQLQEKGIRAAEDLQAKEEARLAQITVHNLLDESQSVLSKTPLPPSQQQNIQNFPFSRLDPPVAGERVKDPSLQKKFSPQTQGVIFQTEKGATVHAPAKGTVVFRGPFRSQGEILILDHGQKVHTVYMGMEMIKVDMGQAVYAGEKMGTMPSYGKGKPLLYLELRQDGKPINPFPYLRE